MAFYTTVRYRLKWESRSSASQGAALQRRMATNSNVQLVSVTEGFNAQSVSAMYNTESSRVDAFLIESSRSSNGTFNTFVGFISSKSNELQETTASQIKSRLLGQIHSLLNEAGSKK